MEVAIFGTDYVGLLTRTCLADAGHDVVRADVGRRTHKATDKAAGHDVGSRCHGQEAMR